MSFIESCTESASANTTSPDVLPDPLSAESSQNCDNVATGSFSGEPSFSEPVALPLQSVVSSSEVPNSNTSQRSSVLSHQVSVIIPPSHYGRLSNAYSRLDPRVPPFQPRLRSGTWKEPPFSLSVDAQGSLASRPIPSYVVNDNTLVKTHLGNSVCTLDS